MIISHATSGDLVDIFVSDLGTTGSAARFYAQDLRRRGLLRGKGQQGTSVRLSTVEANRWLIAQLVAPSVASSATTIARVRGADFSSATFHPFIRADGSTMPTDENRRCVAAFAHGLSFATAPTFGEALDSIVDDFRSGAWAAWAGEAPYELIFEFIDAGNHMQIYLTRKGTYESVVYQYAPAKPAPKIGQAVTQILRLQGTTLERIAGALGPLHTT